MSATTKRSTVAVLALIFASAIAVNAEPQHRGGGFGRGHPEHGFGRADRFPGRPEFNRRFDVAGRPRFIGGRRFVGPGFFVSAGFFDPIWGVYYPYGLFPFPYYPYSAYAYGLTLDSDVTVRVTPTDAQVFVDGYYAGVADSFGGAFERLHVTPGGHVITIYLDGYRTLSRSIYARPGASVTFRDRLEPLGAGEVSAPPSPPVSPTVPAIPVQVPADVSE